jgi:tRNA threonylcarbamoyladenosine biosynthesis protein TsaB
MNILAFDTCFGATSAAVAWGFDPDTPGGTALGTASRFERMEKGHAERLLPMIEDVLGDAPIRVSDIDRIVVTVGPGTFTGARIGIAAARAFSLATGAHVCGATTLALLSYQASCELTLARCRGKDLAIAMDARRGEVYFQLFGGEARRPLTEPLIVAPDSAASMLRDKDTIIAGSGACQVQEAARNAVGRLETALQDLEPDARYLVGLSGLKHLDPPRPLYLRRPDAKAQDGKSLAYLP